MKTLERIFLYSVLAVLVFYVFLVDGNVESQVAIQEEIRSRRIAIVNDEGQATIFLTSNEYGGEIQIYNKYKDFAVLIRVISNDEGQISIFDKYGKGR